MAPKAEAEAVPVPSKDKKKEKEEKDGKYIPKRYSQKLKKLH